MIADAVVRPKQAPPFAPHPWQINPWRDKSFVMLCTGSAGGGKSKLAAEKAHAFCAKYPGVTALMLRKTRESTTNSIVAFMKQAVMGAQLGKTVHHVVGESSFKYSNGSQLIYGGMKNDEQRERVRSIGGTGGVDLIWLEEATQFDEGDFNELLARMRGNAAGWRQIILTTNPDSPTHWIYKRLIQGGEATVYYSGESDNPSNPAQYHDILSKLTGVQYERLVEGKWKNAEGAVYKDFSAERHILKRLPAKTLFQRYVIGVDWGFTNPGVMQVWGGDHDNRMLLVEEIYRTGELVSADGGDGYWLEQAKRLQTHYEPEAFVCDPSQPAYIQTLINAGLYAIPADNDIQSGITSVTNRLRPAKDGKPRMFFYQFAMSEADPAREEAKEPTGCLDEIVGYAWPKKPKPDMPVKEVPVKKNDHAMDTMRYVSKYYDGDEGVFFA